MRKLRASAALAPFALILSAPAQADNPNDKMTAEDLARDHATIQRLNREQLAAVNRRDAGYAQGWRAYRRAHGGAQDGDAYADQRRDYARERREYEQAMADWREDVAACRAGYYKRCAR